MQREAVGIAILLEMSSFKNSFISNCFFFFVSFVFVLSLLIWFGLYLAYRKGLYISDVPIHDATRDLVLLSEQFEAGYKLTRNLEVLTDKLQQTYRELESEKQKTDR